MNQFKLNIDISSKSAEALLEKVSAAIGAVYEPTKIRRLAKASADAQVIEAKGDLEVADLQKRAASRFLQEEMRKQENIESVLGKAVPLLDDTATPEAIEDDWVAHFFERSRIVSDGEMQTLWAKLLAGEANEPGSCSKRTLDILSCLDKADAELFTTLCGYVVFFEEPSFLAPLIFDLDTPVYKDNGITPETITHLDNAGLARVDPLPERVLKITPGVTRLFYYGRHIDLANPADSPSASPVQISIGKVTLTREGRQLGFFAEAPEQEGFYEYLVEHFKKSWK